MVRGERIERFVSDEETFALSVTPQNEGEGEGRQDGETHK